MCFRFFALLSIITYLFSCQYSSDTTTNNLMNNQNNPSSNEDTDWWKDANIYEVNIRQFTPEGTFAAFRRQLPRLRKMGIDILWFMPIHPISQTNRKGSLGSPYAVSDYRGINPDFGSLVEFKDIIDEAHEMGFKVVLDWVANHTGHDHIWIKEHPDFYTKDTGGNFQTPYDADGKLTDWTDVVELDYNNPAMRQAMIEDMKFWVREADIDGFRCDVAFLVPDDFWVNARKALDEIKPVFMLAESEKPEHRNNGSFDATYAWSYFHLINDVAKGTKNAQNVYECYESDRSRFKKGFHISFITNHDENSWLGTVTERLGQSSKAMAVLSYTMTGMPMLYGGQEANLNKRLKFFDKDEIEWTDLSLQSFYTTLLNAKHDNPALWNGKAGGQFKRIKTNKDKDILAFSKVKDKNKVVVVVNLSNEPQVIKLDSKDIAGVYNDIFNGMTITLENERLVPLEAWGYLVLTSEE